MIHLAINEGTTYFHFKNLLYRSKSCKTQKRPVPTGTDPYRSLAASYSHRGKPPTTIGAEE
ncbi:hypothetical protein ABE040_20390, partial [Bacillus safensis]